MDCHIMFITRLHGHHRQTGSICFRQLFGSYIMIFAIIEPCRIISCKVIGRQFGLHIYTRSFSIRYFITECKAVIISTDNQLHPLRLSGRIHQIDHQFIKMIFNHSPFTPKRFPFIPYFPVGYFLYFPTGRRNRLL